MRLGADRTIAALRAGGVHDADVTVQALGVICRVRPAQIVPTLAALRTADYEVLVDLFATDAGKRLEITYHLRCPEDLREVYVRARVGYDAVVHSAVEVFPAAALAEREAAELFGLTFSGHPDMRRLLTTGDVPAPQMRRSVRVRDGGWGT